ncbi:MAG: cytochrome c oxidase accessory protein CcoG [Bacteroidota bacterium]
MQVPIVDTEQYRDKVATIDAQGRRIWLHPKKPKGPYYEWRKYVSYGLLLFLFGMPFIKVGGYPLLLFNILERRFIIFGLHFTPQDFHLFVFGMLIFIIFIALFTVVFGRLFCGWVCPQTIFMEMVFRRIEYWIEGDANAQKRLNKAPWNTDKIIKKGSKQLIFFTIAILVANTFLAYIIGIDEVFTIISEPIDQHLSGFTAMVLFSFAFYFVFSYMREQVCVTICPYGRLQGVLLDKNSIAVYYDFVRGEPRGKMKRKKQALPSAKELILGDCIDCKLCVQVCPTGIDIRDGVQLECVNCTACMDACDEVMEKIGRPKELIRYDSYNGIKQGIRKIFTPRVIAYTAVLAVLLVIQIVLLVGRSDVETLLLRTPGMLYQQTEQGDISNLYNYQIINKTTKEMPIEFRLVGIEGKIRLVGKAPVAQKDDITEGALFIDLPPAALDNRKTKIRVEVYSAGELIDEVKTNFLGPVK